MVDPTSLATWAGYVFWLGVVILAGGLAYLFWKHSVPAMKRGGIVAGLGLVIVIVGVLGATLTPTATTGSTAPPPSGGAVSSYVSSTPSLPTGCTLNSALSTPTVTCTTVYNYTSNYFAIQASNATTFHSPTALFLAIHSARTDGINRTFGFNYQVLSIPTANSLGANPQTYSLLGFTPATSTANGQWLVSWGGVGGNAGSAAGQLSTVNAPSVSTNLGVNTVGIGSFSSSTPYLHVVLAGSNGTSAPATFYSALQTFTPYSVTIGVSSSTPASFLLNFIVIGEHA